MEDSIPSGEASTEAAIFFFFFFFNVTLRIRWPTGQQKFLNEKFRLEYKIIFTEQNYESLNTNGFLLNTNMNC